MVGEGYIATTNEDKSAFWFFSIGPQGIIFKRIIYSPYAEDVWNLGFGDDQDGEIDSKVISNNNDLRKVIQTVANTVYLFTEVYPERKVLILPVDNKRKSLYNTIFQRKWEEIKRGFYVEGFLFKEQIKMPYDPEISFDGFLVWRKQPIFESKTI